MTPLLDEPFRDWKTAAFSQYARCDLDASTGLYARCSGDNRDTIEGGCVPHIYFSIRVVFLSSCGEKHTNGLVAH